MSLYRRKTLWLLSRLTLLVIVAGLANVNSVLAQPAGPVSPEKMPPGGVLRPGDIKPELPSLEPEPVAPLVVPEEAPPEEKEKKPYGIRVFVKEIRISGNTVFSDEELGKITKKYENREVTTSELEDLRVALTKYYISHGYINSGAIIPDQKVTDGVINIIIIEGKLTDIIVSGNKHLSSNYISKRLMLGAGPPLNVNDLQEQIQITLESPVVSTLNSALRPGDRPGEATLTTVVQEGPRFQFIPLVDNRLSPSLGAARLVLPIYVYDITGQGDVFSAAAGLGEGLTDGWFNWAVPINAHDTTLHLFADLSDTKIVKGPFEELDITNRTDTVGFRISHPFYRTINQNFTMATGIDLRSSQSELLGEPFAFTPGVPPDGKVDISVLRFSQDWTDRRSQQVLAARSVFSWGLDAFNATINTGDEPSGKYFSWLGQFQIARLLSNDLGQIIFRTDVQLTKDPLFTMEQFSVGGALSVRGYQENQLVRDRGYDASIEYRYPLIADPSGRSILAVAPFFDAGGGKNNVLPDGPNPNFISSAGLGLRWNPTTKIHAEVYYGYPFKDVVDNGIDDLQNKGFTFLISANLINLM